MKRNENERKPYKSPEVRKVTLVVEEAVLQACKTARSDRTGFFRCGFALCRRTIGS